jgi:GNAT superfamily N-acetyltransferase
MVTIRTATTDDVPSLTLLMDDLGYTTTADEMQTRFSHINRHADYRTLVAISGNDEIAEMIGLIKSYYFEHNGMYIRVAALVVGKEHRNKGIGKILMLEAEKWALEIGAPTILLNSGNREERVAAFSFYQKMGYSIKSSGFVKVLN